ncbi:hypothetical protein BJX62DRAFT_40228 [Aspergillus germanicus]
MDSGNGSHNGKCVSFKQFFAELFSKEEILEHALDLIKRASHCHEIIYRNVQPPVAAYLLEHLEELTSQKTIRKTFNSVTQAVRLVAMPTSIHNCIQGWVTSEVGMWCGRGILNEDEVGHLEVEAGTTLHFDYPPYAGSSKEPDLSIKYQDDLLPPIVIETGWSETHAKLLDDMNLLLVGGNGSIRAAVFVDWQVTAAGNVRGKIELYVLDRAGMPIRRQCEDIFPEPAPQVAAAQEITFTRRMLFGSNIARGRNPRDICSLRLDVLRNKARAALRSMNLSPA